MKFKLWMLSLGLMAVTVGQASAQSFNLGLEAGANFSDFIGSGVSQVSNVNDSKLGFVGGGFLSLNFSNSFAIRPEVLYEQKGAQISGTGTTAELDYVEVPVLLKIGLGTPVINPSILLGPSFSWNILAQSNGKNISNNINSSDVGLVGGLEIDIDKFLVSGRYELGLDNVVNNTQVQNGTITLLVGYSFI
jgi:hypothetical protein